MRTISPLTPWTLTGSAGSAGGTFTIGVGGEVSRVFGVEPLYGAGSAATTVMAFANLGRTFFTTPASNTQIYYPILETAYGTNGTVLSTGNPFVECIVSGTVTITVSGGNPGTGYGVEIFLLDGGS